MSSRSARSIPAKAGQSERYYVEYERNSVAHVMAFYASFESWRRMAVADNHTAEQWAEGVRQLVLEDYPRAKRITSVMDNLNTPTGASLYKAFPPAVARSLLDKLEYVITPKRGSMLNMAKCEFSVLSRQCQDRGDSRISRRSPLRFRHGRRNEINPTNPSTVVSPPTMLELN
jgi:hypothetical protein